MKRILTAALALVLIVSCVSLFACGKEDGSDTLRVAMECSYATYN